MPRPRRKFPALPMVIVAMGFTIIVGIWIFMEPGGWPLDWRLVSTLIVFGIFTGGASVGQEAS